MEKPTDSFKQFDYGLRPSKQVERKIIIEVLHALARAHYDLSTYTYLGFGSVYYVDFVLFHKHLFIENMICIEWGEIERRMKFNKPFKFIRLKLMPLSSFIPRIQVNTKYLTWLDYDWALDPDMLRDIDGCMNQLSPQSVFLITIDARSKLPNDDFDIEKMSEKERRCTTLRMYNTWFRPYIGRRVTQDDLDGKRVAALFYETVLERIRESLRARDLKFHQLFHFLYADGAQMLTIGGIIGGPSDAQQLQASGINNHKFVRSGVDFLWIKVPPLTIREKQWLDKNMRDSLTLDRLAFELDDEELLDNYRKFYKEYPTYTEAML